MPAPAPPGSGRRLRLRDKLLLFSILLALIPIGISGRRLVSLTATELKSSVNDELVTTAEQVVREIDSLYLDSWRGPLLILRDALAREDLGAKEKLALLTTIRQVDDVVALQVSVEGVARPILITQDTFADRLRGAGLDPAAVLELAPRQIQQLKRPSGETSVGGLAYLPQVDTWLVTVVVPLEKPLLDRPATLLARVKLDRLAERLRHHPFQKTGTLELVDADGRRIFDKDRTDLSERKVVAEAKQLLARGARAIGVMPYTRPSGARMLGGYAFPEQFDWAVILEKNESEAYLTVSRMNQSLLFWCLVGVAVASVGAVVFSLRISRPLQWIAQVTDRVGQGDFEARVGELRSRDEVADLGRQIDRMILGLAERDRVKDIFGRYVTREVVATLLGSPRGLEFGGERRRVTIMMTDLRGFTSLSERLQPEQVVRMLNDYLEAMVDICVKHQGTINEIIGDALLVIFGAPLETPDHARRAVACALEMELAMERVNAHNRALGLPELEMGIGLNTGEVVVGNIGSKKRTKYGVVGSDVNLTSRIESYTVGGQVLVSGATRIAAGDGLRIDGQMEVQPKGVKRPMTIYEVGGIDGPYHLYLPERREALQALPAEVAFRYTVVEGKDTGGAALTGALLRLSANQGELRLAGPVAPLTNLKLQLAGGAAAGQELYAKVLGPAGGTPELHLIRFTSVPPEAAAWIKGLLSAPPAPAAP